MGAILLRNGQRFDPFGDDPLPPVWVFTRALCMISRYTGHTLRPYTVGEHSFRLAEAKQVKEAGLSRAAVLHDFSEAIFNDMASPVKREMPEYSAAETRLQRRIFTHWNEPWENMNRLMEFDHRICLDEMLSLFDGVTPWCEPLGVFVPQTEFHWKEVHFGLEHLCNELEIL